MNPILRAILLGGGAATYDYYVDSVNGNDANDGRSLTTAFASLATAQAALSNGNRLAFARGSHWRETFTIPATDLIFGVVGSGAMPIIDGADVVSGTWTNVSGNIWSISWSRASVGTGNEPMGLWADGVRPTYVTPYTSMSTDGQWSTSSLTAQTPTLYIYSTTDPNSNGVLYEAGVRNWAFNGHPTTLVATRTVTYRGPFELKRFLGHYNAGSFGPGSAAKFFLRDGTIHHSVSAAVDNQWQLGTEYSPQVGPSVLDAYLADGTAFDTLYSKCGALLGDGDTRVNGSALYGHSSSTPANVRTETFNFCFSRGINCLGAAADIFYANDCFAQDVYQVGFSTTSATAAVLRRCLLKDTGTPQSILRGIRRLTVCDLDAQDCALQQLAGDVFQNQTSVGGAVALRNMALVTGNASCVYGGGTLDLTKSILWCDARVMDQLSTGYTGDFNVFYRSTDANGYPGIYWNGALYNNALSAFQAASGQDANSVSLKSSDQATGNANAFWLGVSTSVNSGPVDGDFRINPNAKVYGGDGTAYTGTFADGVTPITDAGPQSHSDWSSFLTVSGPPEKFPTLPSSIAEMREFVEQTWNFYP